MKLENDWQKARYFRLRCKRASADEVERQRDLVECTGVILADYIIDVTTSNNRCSLFAPDVCLIGKKQKISLSRSLILPS